MTKRRTKGEGTIYQRKDGRWVGQYTTDTFDGVKRRSVYGKDKKDVRAKLTEAIANRDKGLVFDAQGLSVGEYLDRWLVAIEGTIGERTWKRHEMVVRLHVKPSVGKTRLAALTPLQVQALYRAKSRTHLSPGSVKRIHTTLHKALKQAVRWQMIPRNPCDSVDSPKGYRGEIRGSASRRVANVTISYRAAVQSDGASPRAKSCQPTGGSSKAARRKTGEDVARHGKRGTASTLCFLCVGSIYRPTTVGIDRP